MALLRPSYAFKRITDINPEFFTEKGIKCLLLDVDNTLTTHDNPVPATGVESWLEEIKSKGINAVILSNNSDERVKPFAKRLGLSYIPRACKPLTFGITRACREHNLGTNEIALIGDQIFTDIIGGNLKGILTVLVEPYEIEDKFFLKFKRKIEKPILKRIKRFNDEN